MGGQLSGHPATRRLKMSSMALCCHLAADGGKTAHPPGEVAGGWGRQGRWSPGHQVGRVTKTGVRVPGGRCPCPSTILQVTALSPRPVDKGPRGSEHGHDTGE